MEPQDKKETIKHEFIIDDGRIESLQEFLTPEQLYNDLILRVRKYHPSDDITLIEIPYTEEHLINYDYILTRAGY